jgi:catechol 2,3-dioxygenase-like lactoylglutathione lyase family enzyme
MRWRGVSHVELAVLNYNDSIAFYDALFGWLGYKSFSSLNMEYQSMYYMTRFANAHSYIGIQPARAGGRLTHSDQAVGINHIALWARSRAEVDGSWHGYRNFPRPGRFGRPIAHFTLSPRIGQIWRTRCLALAGRREGPCRPDNRTTPFSRSSRAVVDTMRDPRRCG